MRPRVLLKERPGEAGHTPSRRQGEDGGRDGSDVAACPGMAEATRGQGRQGVDPPQGLGGSCFQSSGTGLGLLALGTVRGHLSAVSSHSVCSRSHEKLTRPGNERGVRADTAERMGLSGQADLEPDPAGRDLGHDLGPSHPHGCGTRTTRMWPLPVPCRAGRARRSQAAFCPSLAQSTCQRRPLGGRPRGRVTRNAATVPVVTGTGLYRAPAERQLV